MAIPLIWKVPQNTAATRKPRHAPGGLAYHLINMAKRQKPKDIDDYISKLPADVQVILRKCGKRSVMPRRKAKETISYMIPAFRRQGILVYFAAWEKHIGMYPPISGNKTLEKAIARYAGPKGNLQFPFDEPIPYDLIERIVKLRVKQDSEKAAARHRSKSGSGQGRNGKQRLLRTDTPLRSRG